MLLVKPIRYHLPWICLAIALILVSFGWHYQASIAAGRWVGGSSLAGLTVGSLAASIILIEILLWPRKRLRRYRLGRTKVWMSAHLWLGLATGPLALIHSGYHLGGMLSTTLMALLALVLISGIYGWVAQTLIPKWMLVNLPAETIASQIDHVSRQSVQDARTMLTVACGVSPSEARDILLDRWNTLGPEDGSGSTIVIGAVNQRGSLRGRTLVTTQVQVEPQDHATIWQQYSSVVEPFLLGEQLAQNSLGESSRSAQWFTMFRSSCSPSAEIVIDRLEDLCNQRRQFNTQRRANGWLHGWIAFHAGISVLLATLLIAHIILAIRFW